MELRPGRRHSRARYVDAVQRFAPAEAGIGVLLNILGNASTALEHYVPADARDALREAFAAAAARELRGAAPGYGPAACLGADAGNAQPHRRQPGCRC